MMFRNADFADGVKEAAFQHALECGDPLALPLTDEMSPNDRRLHINAWFRLASKREPYLKDLLKPDEGELPPPDAEPEVVCGDLWDDGICHRDVSAETHRHKQMSALMLIWREVFYDHYFENVALTKSGECARHGVAALYRFTATLRHYRKKARIKGAVCRPMTIEERRVMNVMPPHFDPHDYYIDHMRRDRERVRCWESGLRSDDETFAERGTLDYRDTGGYGWERQLTRHNWGHRGLSLAARLGMFKHNKQRERDNRNRERRDRRELKQQVLRNMSAADLRKMLRQKEAALA